MNGADARAFEDAQSQKAVRLLKLVLALALLCGFALSRRLWVSPSPSRLYTNVPAFDFLPTTGTPLDYVLFGALVLLLVVVALRARPRVEAFALVALGALLVLFDLSRLQPWVYQYLFLISALAAYSWTGDARATLRACGLVLACVYFWSGVQKLNPQFFAEVVPSLAGPYLARLPASFARLATPLAVLIPLIEICAGLMLLTRRSRRVGVVLAVLTHLAVLLLFVPLRRNNIIWPWNVAMAALAVVIFWRDASGFRDFLPRRILSFQTLALALFGLLPALGLFRLWGQYQSAALYSGNVTRAEFIVGEGVARKLPTRVRQKLRPTDGGLRLDINQWSYAELNVPAYPSERVYRRAAAALCLLAESPSDVRLEVSEPPRFFFDAARTKTTLDCDDLTER